MHQVAERCMCLWGAAPHPIDGVIQHTVYDPYYLHNISDI